jgi:hypothetical protein
LATDCDGDVGGRLELAVKGAGRRPDVDDCVPRFLDDETAPRIVAEADVDRVGRICATDPELERTERADRARQAEEKLLDGEVARVVRLVAPVACVLERRPQVEGRRERKPDTNRGAIAIAELQPADLALAEAETIAELSLGPPATAASIPCPASQRPDGLGCEPVDLDGSGRAARGAGWAGSWSHGPFHTRRMITDAPWRRLTLVFAGG